MTTKEKCQLCGENFKNGERYDDFGATYEDDTKDNYYCHIDCVKKEMDKYRNSNDLNKKKTKWKKKW